MEEDYKKMLKTLGYLSSIGIAMGLSIGLGAFIGHYLDRILGTRPWLFFLFLAFGIAAAFRNLYLLYRKGKDLG